MQAWIRASLPALAVGLRRPHTELQQALDHGCSLTEVQLARCLPISPPDASAHSLPLQAGPELMQQEPQEAAEKLRLVLKVLGTFKSYFLEYKARSIAQVPSNPWRVQSGALFGRLDAFLARCQDVLELCRTRQEVRVCRHCVAVLWVVGQGAVAVCFPMPTARCCSSQSCLTLAPLLQFNRLERVDVGGARGHLLTSGVRAVHSDFLLAAQRFQQVSPAHDAEQAVDATSGSAVLGWMAGSLQLPWTRGGGVSAALRPSVLASDLHVRPASQLEYDVMDVDESRFSEDYGQTKRAVQDLDRRLASLIIQVC